MARLNAEQTKYNSKKTKSQATRVRASLLELKKACDGARKTTLDEAKSIPVKARTKKLVPVDTQNEEPPSPPKLERQTAEIKEG
jgi:ribosomal protein L22